MQFKSNKNCYKVIKLRKIRNTSKCGLLNASDVCLKIDLPVLGDDTVPPLFMA